MGRQDIVHSPCNLFGMFVWALCPAIYASSLRIMKSIHVTIRQSSCIVGRFLVLHHSVIQHLHYVPITSTVVVNCSSTTLSALSASAAPDSCAHDELELASSCSIRSDTSIIEFPATATAEVLRLSGEAQLSHSVHCINNS